MQNDERVVRALAKLGGTSEQTLPDGFMDGVWLRAGRLEEISARRTRFAMFAAMAFIGLGAGFGTTQTPAHAKPTGFQLVEGADLSPASLLRLEP